MVGEDNISNPLMEEMCANDIGYVDDAPPSSTSITERKFWPIISGEHLEIKAYAALYSGRTKIMRLIFIFDHCDNTVIHLESLRMAYDELKKGENNQLFREIVQKIDGRLGPNYLMDSACCAMVDRKAEQRKEKLMVSN
ncbi:COP9 signalosome complex subunit 1-like [Hibiscus syriacus]|uniref:COP9 signalosome complex subunit 1-like n=1 Tax=Hibiscus syriacus TaxID=106335 RepID=UPI0019249CA2|nr:COP9 signalosome complex subunit 1-like [Hibiscus syriacus]